jgi:hypothetical protein
MESKTARSRVTWDEKEWDKLAALVYTMRRKSPESIATLANRAQKQFPQDRRRPGSIHTAQLKPLVERILKREHEVEILSERAEEYAAKLSFLDDVPKTKDGILEALTETEIRDRFLPQIIRLLTPADVLAAFPAEQLLESVSTSDLAAMVARRLVAQWERPINLTVHVPEPMASHSKPRPTNGRQKHILVVGTTRDQPRHIREGVGSLCQLSFVELDRHTRFEKFPKNVDHVFVCSKFLTHAHLATVLGSFEPRKITQHFGGVSQLIAAIKQTCELVSV